MTERDHNSDTSQRGGDAVFVGVLMIMVTTAAVVVGVPVYRATSWWADRTHRRNLRRSRVRRL